jgi:DNA-binding protein YbaB
MSMFDDVDRPAVGVPGALDRLRSQTFTGRDPENLVTAEVTGAGMVNRITFAATVTTRRPPAVATAVLAAIADAQRRGVEAMVELAAARESSEPNGSPATDGIVGGTA